LLPAGYARVAAVGVGEEKAAILPRPACYSFVLRLGWAIFDLPICRGGLLG